MTEEKYPSLFPDDTALREIKRGRTKGKRDTTYEDFVEKFKNPKTTDDCYTPEKVYAVILDFVRKNADIEGKQVVRPFWPGGDYENYEYPENCVVIDNPPFSLMSRIIRFYSAHSVPFFLFAPALTLFTAPDADVTYIVTGAGIIYENGANVSTSFVSNLFPDLRIWVCPDLLDAIKQAQAEPSKKLRGFIYPDNLVTAATLQKLAHHDTELKVRKAACAYVKESHAARAHGRSLFGGGIS